jgi:hypothetical protein
VVQITRFLLGTGLRNFVVDAFNERCGGSGGSSRGGIQTPPSLFCVEKHHIMKYTKRRLDDPTAHG